MIENQRIRVVEVGPRDGFQNIKTFIPTETKYAIIADMFAAGVSEMEFTSFVSPRAIPQMADAWELAVRVVKEYGAGKRLIALVPNLRGAQTALECGVGTVSYVISASERHNMENVRKTPAESLADLKQLRREMPELKVRLDIGTAFGCPFLGAISEDSVMALAKEGVQAGVCEVVLCDTIGIGNPSQVRRLSERAIRELPVPVGLHLHDTRGLGLANTLAGMLAGVTLFETSLAGLGGCPFAPGAAGNTATEDLLNMLAAMGLETGVELGDFLDAVKMVVEQVEPTAGGHVFKASSACAK